MPEENQITNTNTPIPTPSPDDPSSKSLLSNKPKGSLLWVLLIIILLVIGGAFYLGTQSKPQQETVSNPSSSLPNQEVKKDEKESLIINNCKTESTCSIEQFSVNGTKIDFQDKYNINKASVLFSKNGNYMVYISENGELFVVNLESDSTKNIPTSKKAKLLSMNNDSFWIEDNSTYKLVGLNGDTKTTINKSLIPGRSSDREDEYMDLSSLYPGNKVLAVSSLTTEGSVLRTAWEIVPNEKPKRLFDLDLNYGELYIERVDFFNNEPAFLVDNGAGEIYKLTTTNQKSVLINSKGSDLEALSIDDSELFYSIFNGGYSQSDLDGLYMFSLKTYSTKQLIRANDYKTSNQSADRYHVSSISPSGKYLAIKEYIVPVPKSVSGAAILSLEDLSIARLPKSEDFYNLIDKGWINY